MTHENELKPYLPTSQKLKEMNLTEFSFWVSDAYYILQRRKIERDPLFHLKKRISEILDEAISEVEKEEMIFDVIRSYYKRINQ
ncbi:hypothetical protein [Paenibacillus larvae]|uniref:hypothetical protein n=1 Tax=Paenibacillus larvae TaxID=1464 RepID=UPI000169551E|nr:hypothetical protein [Paenibacillus larvae]ETK27407.1 hypothetical protein ERIC1_1c08520 [Paenibacillus larvae subsp. larvae DSM 25719]MDT2268145.1 hypothetical protein [Paenibacillus larvae]MDT2277869.1 hypothetical protein [Paenibacillus larvae]MDT2306299.1 hypothetical protein [Paenibacillus larvae]